VGLDALTSHDELALLPPTAPASESTDEIAGRLDALRPHLIAVARSMLIDRAEAEDLVQATLEIGLRRLYQLRDPSALRSWLVAIEIREAYRLGRILRRIVRAPYAAASEEPDPAEPARDAEVRDLLRHLPRRRRASVVLHVMAGLSISETARALGVSENTVKTQVRKGLATLREELTDGAW
jgi:RNA polymerase sigma-70 factor (ECF subfamily)